MQRPHKTLDTNANDFWLARGAVLVIVGLQLGIVNDLTVDPRWLARQVWNSRSCYRCLLRPHGLKRPLEKRPPILNGSWSAGIGAASACWPSR